VRHGPVRRALHRVQPFSFCLLLIRGHRLFDPRASVFKIKRSFLRRSAEIGAMADRSAAHSIGFNPCPSNFF
jgi:hypothetical protein